MVMPFIDEFFEMMDDIEFLEEEVFELTEDIEELSDVIDDWF